MIRYQETHIGHIGFHGIPLHVSDGSPYMTEAELGTRLSGGCQRQANRDAAFMWAFATGRHDGGRHLTLGLGERASLLASPPVLAAAAPQRRSPA